jgi:hypothetical protein
MPSKNQNNNNNNNSKNNTTLSKSTPTMPWRHNRHEITSRCVCGKVRLVVPYSAIKAQMQMQLQQQQKVEEVVADCHCRSCRKFHAAAFATYLLVPHEHVTIYINENDDNDNSSVKTFRDVCHHVGGPVERLFCASCCTKLATRPIVVLSSDVVNGDNNNSMDTADAVHGATATTPTTTTPGPYDHLTFVNLGAVDDRTIPAAWAAQWARAIIPRPNKSAAAAATAAATITTTNQQQQQSTAPSAATTTTTRAATSTITAQQAQQESAGGSSTSTSSATTITPTPRIPLPRLPPLPLPTATTATTTATTTTFPPTAGSRTQWQWDSRATWNNNNNNNNKQDATTGNKSGSKSQVGGKTTATTASSLTTLSSCWTGSCACGSCRYKITLQQPDETTELQHCYCRLCRRLSGGPFQTWMPFDLLPRPQFTWISEKGPPLKRFTNHGRRHVCTTCGGVLTIVYDGQEDDMIWPAAGTLDDDDDDSLPLQLQPPPLPVGVVASVPSESSSSSSTPSSSSSTAAAATAAAARTITKQQATTRQEEQPRLLPLPLHSVLHICCKYRQRWYELPHDGNPRIFDAS